MIRLLISLVTAGAVIGCQMEDTETSGTLNVDPNSEQEVPEWVTARYLDLNRDGTIDIKDLVIMSKFFGQDVPEGEVASASDGSDPCRDIRAGLAKPKLERVEDNTDFKEFFEAPDNGRYVYALLAVVRFASKWGIDLSPACIAVRFQINENHEVQGFKIKSVSESKLLYTKTMTAITPRKDRSYLAPAFKSSDCIEASGHDYKSLITTGAKELGVAEGAVMVRGQLPSHCQAEMEGGYGDAAFKFTARDRQFKKGIPISTDKVIGYLNFFSDTEEIIPDNYNHKGITSHWQITQRNRDPLDRLSSGDQGVYIKMLPAEVRRRYFREDEATGN